MKKIRILIHIITCPTMSVIISLYVHCFLFANVACLAKKLSREKKPLLRIEPRISNNTMHMTMQSSYSTNKSVKSHTIATKKSQRLSVSSSNPVNGIRSQVRVEKQQS